MATDRQILLFDPTSGISGDMSLGALAALGLDQEALRAALETLPIRGWSLDFSALRISGIEAIDARVEVPAEGHHRHLPEIERIIRAGRLPGAAAERALAVFARLAAAEAQVHGVPVEKIHFHEVGAMDAIIDIVGVSVALELLGVAAVRVTPVHVGTGTLTCEHGQMPVPAPATAILLQGFPVVHTGVSAELVTPTGAALLAALAEPVAAGWSAVPLRSGFGAGKRTLPGGRPNFLRAMLWREEVPANGIVVLEANVDDMSPEVAPYVIERLLEAGALDAFLVPIIMKGGRPASIFTVMAAPDASDKLTHILLHETTTLGVRQRWSDRHVTIREIRRVQTSWGPVGIKLAQLPDGSRRAAPEYRDCAALARERGVPLLEVLEEARAAGRKLL